MSIIHKLSNRRNLRWLPLLWIAMFLFFPIILLFVDGAFVVAFSRTFITVSDTAIFNSHYLHSVASSFSISLLSATFATIFGFYLAYFITFLRNNIKYLFVIVLLISFLLNPIIQYQAIANVFRDNGIINTTLLNLSIINSPFEIGEFWIIAICMIFKFIPIACFLSIVPLNRSNPSLIESYMDLGANRFYIFGNHIYKNTRKNLVATLLIIFSICFYNVGIPISSSISNSFIAPMIFNEYSANYVIGTDILTVVYQLLPIFLINIFFILAYNAYYNRNFKKIFSPTQKKISRYKCITLGKEPLTILINSAIIVFYLLILFLAVLFSFNEICSVSVFSGFSLSWYAELFSNAVALDGIKNQFGIAGCVALLSTILASMLALSASKYSDLMKHTFSKYSTMALLLGEILVGVALGFFTHTINLNEQLSGIIGLSIFCMIFATIIIYRHIKGFDENLENASLDLGANFFQTLSKIKFPSLFPGIAYTYLLIFIFAINEFTLSFITTQAQLPMLSASLLEFALVPTPMFNALATLLLFLSMFILFCANPSHIHNRKKVLINYLLCVIILTLSIICVI